jgi:anthranilate synthase/aminodeoxychorismate synthase-like glutamine amidotransferase
MPRLLVIDNYDSFTYNLVQYLGELGAELDVVRNDVAPLDELLARAPDGVVISPGPGRPEDAGVTVPAVRAFGERGIPLLGVCLGHQAIGEACGGRIVGARTLMHGKTSWIHHDGRGVFRGLSNPFEATRYHSLVIERESCPTELEITAWTEDGEIMGVRHRTLPLEGVQFHPESILTQEGKRLLANFLARCGGGARRAA